MEGGVDIASLRQCFSMVDSCDVGVQVLADDVAASHDVCVQVGSRINDLDLQFDIMNKA